MHIAVAFVHISLHFISLLWASLLHSHSRLSLQQLQERRGEACVEGFCTPRSRMACFQCRNRSDSASLTRASRPRERMRNVVLMAVAIGEATTPWPRQLVPANLPMVSQLIVRA